MIIEKCDKCGRTINGTEWLMISKDSRFGGKQFCDSCSRLARIYLQKHGLLVVDNIIKPKLTLSV